jgi:hypothetical protein
MNPLRVNNLFDLDPFDDAFRGFLRPWKFEPMTQAPKIKLDVTEHDDSYALKAEIPGVRKEDIDVRVEGNLVTISAEVKKDREEKKDGRVSTATRPAASRWPAPSTTARPAPSTPTACWSSCCRRRPRQPARSWPSVEAGHRLMCEGTPRAGVADVKSRPEGAHCRCREFRRHPLDAACRFLVVGIDLWRDADRGVRP